MTDLLYAGLTGLCFVVFITLFFSLIGDWLRHCEDKFAEERRKEMTRIAKEMIAEYEASKKK